MTDQDSEDSSSGVPRAAAEQDQCDVDPEISVVPTEDPDGTTHWDMTKEYYVEKIVDKRYNQKTGVPEYFVKWKDFPSSTNTWEPLDHLDNCKNKIKAFEAENGNYSPATSASKHQSGSGSSTKTSSSSASSSRSSSPPPEPPKKKRGRPPKDPKDKVKSSSSSHKSKSKKHKEKEKEKEKEKRKSSSSVNGKHRRQEESSDDDSSDEEPKSKRARKSQKDDSAASLVGEEVFEKSALESIMGVRRGKDTEIVFKIKLDNKKTPLWMSADDLQSGHTTDILEFLYDKFL